MRFRVDILLFEGAVAFGTWGYVYADDLAGARAEIRRLLGELERVRAFQLEGLSPDSDGPDGPDLKTLLLGNWCPTVWEHLELETDRDVESRDG